MHGYAGVSMLQCVVKQAYAHYDVIASRDCRTAVRKQYTTARHSREKARDTDAALLYVCPHVTDLLLPAPSTGWGRPAWFMLHMLIRASLRRRDDRHYWWSQRVICLCRANYGATPLTLACPLQSANAFSLWVISRQVWMQLQLEHRCWKNVTGARLWKRVPDNRILLNNLTIYLHERLFHVDADSRVPLELGRCCSLSGDGLSTQM